MGGWSVLSLVGLLSVCVCWVSADDYYIGAGRYDITGPAAEVEMVSAALVVHVSSVLICSGVIT